MSAISLERKADITSPTKSEEPGASQKLSFYPSIRDERKA